MKRDFGCPYSVLDSDIICEHKTGRVNLPDTITLHNHDGYEIIVFLKGNVSIVVESVEKRLERGDIIIISPYVFHGINLTINAATEVNDYERIVLNIRPSILEHADVDSTDLLSYLSRLGTKQPGVIHVNERDLIEFVAILDSLEAEKNSDCYASELYAKVKLYEFLIELARLSNATKTNEYNNTMPTLVSAIFDLVNEKISSPLTVEDIAKHLNHNSDYISRVFKKNTGHSLKHYISAKKMAMAKKYLSHGYSPSDVCFMVGYENYSSFSRSFHSQIGLSPRQCQKKM